MEIVPAIDLKGGRCVRLTQGEFDKVVTYSGDPLEYALRWEREGAQRLHMVDLDGARLGGPQAESLAVVSEVVRHLRIPVQLGGGMRSMETIDRVLALGVDRVVLGTAAACDEDLLVSALEAHGDRVLVGIDARVGRVAVSGWTNTLDVDARTFARRVEELGGKRIVFTDIARDGMLNGPNLESLRAMLDSTSMQVIASGGVGTVADIAAVAALARPSPEGLIVGKALYAGTVLLPDAIRTAESAA